MEEKNQNSGFHKIFELSNSVSEQNIMSFEQFLRQLLDFEGEKCIYFYCMKILYTWI